MTVRSIASLIMLTQAAAYAAASPATDAGKNVDIESCQVEFDYATSAFDKKLLDDCVGQLKTKSGLKYVQIMTSATPKGSAKYNQKLADSRAQVLATYLETALPSSTYFKTISIGKNYHFGKTGMMNFVYVKDDSVNSALVHNNTSTINHPAPVASTINHPVPAASSNMKVRGAMRVGRDVFMHDYQVPYFAVGADVSVQVQKSKNFRYEIGMQGSQLVNDNYYTLYTFYGFGGAYFTHNGFLVGGRALLGGVTNQDRHLDNDEGAEARLGYEFKGVSVMLDAGRTKDTARYGLELGMSL